MHSRRYGQEHLGNASHQRVVKTYLTIKEKFYIPNLVYHLHEFVCACHICCNYSKETVSTKNKLEL